MDRLRRALAPISTAAWAEIDSEAKRILTAELTARKVVDFDGPRGDEFAAISLGRTKPVDTPIVDDVDATTRLVQPLVELRTEFELSRAELDAVDRGATDADFGPLQRAARSGARCEDKAIFHGFAGASITGMLDASEHEALAISTDYTKYPELIARGLNMLEEASVRGPFLLALGPRCWVGLQQAVLAGGYPAINRVSQMVSGHITRATALDGAALMSLRGGDFQLTVGRDWSIGYASHSADSVRLYLTESLTYRTTGPEAVVRLAYK